MRWFYPGGGDIFLNVMMVVVGWEGDKAERSNGEEEMKDEMR